MLLLRLTRRMAAMFVSVFDVIHDAWPLHKFDNVMLGVELWHPNVYHTYFPKAKHSSLTDDPLETWRVSGNWTSIFGSYSPITTAWGKKQITSFKTQNSDMQFPVIHIGCKSPGVNDTGREWACVLTPYTTAFGLAHEWVWITYLPQLKSEVVHINGHDGVQYVWQAPCCVCACVHLCQSRLHVWLCKYVPSCRQRGFLAYITLYSSQTRDGAKTLLVSKSKNTVTLKTNDLSPRLALPTTARISSVLKISRRQQKQTEDAYRPSAPPQGLESWTLSHWSSCFSLHMCSSLRLRLQLWLCTSFQSTER